MLADFYPSHAGCIPPFISLKTELSPLWGWVGCPNYWVFVRENPNLKWMTTRGVGIDVPTLGDLFHITSPKQPYLLEMKSPTNIWVMFNWDIYQPLLRKSELCEVSGNQRRAPLKHGEVPFYLPLLSELGERSKSEL